MKLFEINEINPEKCEQLRMREKQRKEVLLFQRLLTVTAIIILAKDLPQLNKMRGLDEEAAIEKYSKEYVQNKQNAPKGIFDGG